MKMFAGDFTARSHQVSFFGLVSSATAHLTPAAKIPHQAVSCVADKLWPSRFTSMPRPRKSFSVQRCDASPRRQRKTVPSAMSTPYVACFFSVADAGRSRRLERSPEPFEPDDREISGARCFHLLPRLRRLLANCE
ncbi:hypothetical protein GGI42DRAFT_265960 [Trichoderma sp. SZMC 28013]